ncbi:SET domain containing protein [Lotmaria passim]
MRRAVRPVTCCVWPLSSRRTEHSYSGVNAATAPSTTSSSPSSVSRETPGASGVAGVSSIPRTGNTTQDSSKETSYRTLYPKVRLRAKTQERPYRRSTFTTFEEEEVTQLVSESVDPPQLASSSALATPSPATQAHAEEKRQQQQQHTAVAVQQSQAKEVASLPEGNEVQQFLDEVQRQVDATRFQRNQTIPFPEKPEANSPAFRRVKRHAKMTVEVPDPNYPTFVRKDQAVQLPPAAEHPWVRKNTPIGPFIVHGDGQISQLGGTGQVDFDDTSVNEKLPLSYRGLQHRSILQRQLPQDNGRVVQDAVIKHSFTLTGRGLFATRRIAKGENIMIVQSTARNLGVKGEVERLEEMCADILIACRDGDERMREFLHSWILTGQPSSLLEHWPAASTARVLTAIGGADVLDELELHPIHIARLAAILDLNSFLVESSFAERKGMAYFPEAGFLNHSCDPNATYDIMPEHVFRDSDYYLDEAAAEEEDDVDKPKESGAGDGKKEGVQDAAAPSHSAEGDVAVVRDSPKERNAAYFGNENRLATYPGLTAADAPVYLFCCRASKDIEPGEEILISYVPPQWSFDNRQYVLHDRYHFWCKCPKCAPVLDKKYARVPKLLVGFVVLSIVLQLLVFYQRDLKNAVDEDFNRLAAMSEEDRLEELRRRGISPEELSVEGAKKRKQRRNGLFEMMEEERLRRLYEPDNRGYLTTMDRMNPLSEPPR